VTEVSDYKSDGSANSPAVSRLSKSHQPLAESGPHRPGALQAGL